MVHIFLWNEQTQEYDCVKEGVSREFLKNLMADPVWNQYDFCYLAW